LGDQLHAKRIEANLSQAEVSQKAGVSVRTVRKWEHGIVCPVGCIRQLGGMERVYSPLIILIYNTGPILRTPRARTQTVCQFELTGEMERIGETAAFGDFLNCETCMQQLVGGNAKASFVKILGWGNAVPVPEKL
jgi:DNA-binding XRE family transcriptional regulator